MSEYQGCDKCKWINEAGDGEHCKPCTHNVFGYQDNFQPMTNADRIRNMTDEELAKFLEKAESCGYKDSSITTFENGQYMDMLEWLQTEQTEVEDGAE